MFQGVFTAIITPFKDDKIDYNSFFRILDAQIQSGVAGVVPCGTTGESPTLDYDEHSELIQKTVEYVNKRILVIAGTGSNSTSEAIHLTERACKDGVDGVLSVNPYYNKPTQEGLFLHFKKIAEVSTKPVLICYRIQSNGFLIFQISSRLKKPQVIWGKWQRRFKQLDLKCLFFREMIILLCLYLLLEVKG